MAKDFADKSLTSLSLHGKQITELPTEIGNLINLTLLDLLTNRLTEITPELKMLADRIVKNRGIADFKVNPLPRGSRDYYSGDRSHLDDGLFSLKDEETSPKGGITRRGLSPKPDVHYY